MRIFSLSLLSVSSSNNRQFQSSILLPIKIQALSMHFILQMRNKSKEAIFNNYFFFFHFNNSQFSSSTRFFFIFIFSLILIVNMETLISKGTCLLCEKTREIYICQACSKHFCFDHLSEHRTNIQQQFEHLQNDHDQLQQQINDLKIDPTKHSFIKHIDQWEEESINKIQQQAKLSRTDWSDYLGRFLPIMEQKLNRLAEQIKEIHRENQLNETDLTLFKQRLSKLAKELNQPTNASIEQQSASFINKISLLLPSSKIQWRFSFFFLIIQIFDGNNMLRLSLEKMVKVIN